MAITERRETQHEPANRAGSDFRAISRRAVARNRKALAILDAHDRASKEFPVPSQSKTGGQREG